MSIILALDSSTDACSVALSIHGNIAPKFELAAKSHTQRLLPMVDEVLAETGISLSQIDAIAFGCGPGSFTGLRICMGVVQGLAFGANIPVVPVSTLASIALQYHQAFPEFQYPILVCMDARMNEVYSGLYIIEDGLPSLINEEVVISPESLINSEEILSLKNEFAVVGQGWNCPPLKKLQPLFQRHDIYPNAESIAKIALKIVANGHFQSILGTLPVYLRNNVSWQKRAVPRRQINVD